MGSGRHPPPARLPEIGELTDEALRLLAGRYGVFVTLALSRRYFVMLGENSLSPTQSKICAQQVKTIDATMRRPHLQRLRRELEAELGRDFMARTYR